MTKHNFEAETGKVLELLTHSIYSNKEIFIRELISNASDAIDKARLKALTDTDYLGENNEFKIILTRNEENNTLIIEDNGIGMTEEELHSCIGTIAKSGTGELIEKLKKAKENAENNLIGQFGVGFYSAFMVADKVEMETKSQDSKVAYKWVSDGKNEYEVTISDKKDRGTKVTLFIDEANVELISEWKIKELVKKYSNYIGVPIMMQLEQKNDQGEKNGFKMDQLNETQAIWTKSKSQVKKEEYDAFYKTISHDFSEPLAHIHNNVEGMASYKSLLYIPKQKNMFVNLNDPQIEYGPKLYVKNVLILEHSKELLPMWLRFVSGVVETSDIPLNVSRELLQSNSVLEKIKKGLTKKVISELKKVSKNNPDEYKIFLENYGTLLKEGIYYESDLKEEIAEILTFNTLLETNTIFLDTYIEKNTKKDDIYYIVAKSKSEALASPYLHQFRDAHVDVLILTDHIDSFLMQVFTEYKGKKLISITNNNVVLDELTEEEKVKNEEIKKDYNDLLELTKNTIGSDILERVELNNKLGDALGAIKTPENGMNSQMEEMMKAMGQKVPKQKRILELNPNHYIVHAMRDEFHQNIKSEKLVELMKYAYEQSILLEGGKLENMVDFIGRVNKFAKEYLGK